MATQYARPQPYRLSPPWNDLQIEQLDEMLEILFTDLHAGSVSISADQITSGVLGVEFGGTGLDSISQGDLLYGSATDVISLLSKDTNATRYLSNTGANNNPAWAQVALATGVSGDLPYANLTPATAGSLLLGRGSSGAGDWQEISLGTGLSMSGTTLTNTSSYYEPLTNGDTLFPELIFLDGDVIMVENP